MADCPNCGSEHVYEDYDDEWDGFYERNGRIESVRWGAEICPSCGWEGEPFVWETKVFKDEFEDGLYES